MIASLREKVNMGVTQASDWCEMSKLFACPFNFSSFLGISGVRGGGSSWWAIYTVPLHPSIPVSSPIITNKNALTDTFSGYRGA